MLLMAKSLMKNNHIVLGELPGSYDVDAETYFHALEHPDAHNPDEPYRGVGALFNADLHTTDEHYAPREHWDVMSASRIQHKPVEELIAHLSIAVSSNE